MGRVWGCDRVVGDGCRGAGLTDIALNDGQSFAIAEIMTAIRPGDFHLLTGYAGSGKTTLVQHLAKVLSERGVDVVLTAPTHKAVSVLARKLKETGVAIDCLTIHSLLQLTPKPVGDRMIFERKKRANAVTADVVVIDECSMVPADLMRHIRRHLPVSFVLFVGDPAQLPPVGEVASESFSIKSRSHLDTIVRQAAENPILTAAHTIRKSQGFAMNWSWCVSSKAPPMGVFIPRDPDFWMRKGFTSPEFAADPDTFRYLCWTNDRVASVNQKVRQWIYDGTPPTPFMPGERALARAPVFIGDEKTPIISTNEEMTVLTIAPSTFRRRIKEHVGAVAGWVAEFPCWHLEVEKDDGIKVKLDMPRSERSYQKVLHRIKDEAAEARDRWGEFHAIKQSVAQLQNIYAMTVHTSQGSTFRNVFVDIPDIKRRVASNLLEAQQLFYVAATRPSHALVLIGAP